MTVQQPETIFAQWAKYRSEFRWITQPQAPVWRSWVEYPAVAGDTVHGRLTMIPACHEQPERVAQADYAILAIEGEIDVRIGEELYKLRPLDFLLLKKGTNWSCSNPGLTSSLYFATVGTNDVDVATKDIQVATNAVGEFHEWESYRRSFHWTLPLAERWGYHRGSGPYLSLESIRGHTVRQPPAQRTPWHYAPRDLLFVTVSGEVEFHCAGKHFVLQPLDILLVPAMTPYIYANIGLSEVVFLSIGGSLKPGAKGRYFESDPGWPIRSDAKTLNTEMDPYGDAREVRS